MDYRKFLWRIRIFVWGMYLSNINMLDILAIETNRLKFQ